MSWTNKWIPYEGLKFGYISTIIRLQYTVTLYMYQTCSKRQNYAKMGISSLLNRKLKIL
jgi:hypothetical protein